MLAGIVAYLEVGVHAEEGMEGVLHRQDATNHHRTLGIDGSLALEHLGETLYHTPANGLMLFGTAERQFAMAEIGLVA